MTFSKHPYQQGIAEACRHASDAHRARIQWIVERDIVNERGMKYISETSKSDVKGGEESF